MEQRSNSREPNDEAGIQQYKGKSLIDGQFTLYRNIMDLSKDFTTCVEFLKVVMWDLVFLTHVLLFWKFHIVRPLAAIKYFA